MTALSSIVDGVRVEHAGNAYQSINPAQMDDLVAEVSLGDAGVFVAACRAARRAQPAWRDVPAPVRGSAVANLGQLVERSKEQLARLVTREVGKPYAESLGEVQEVIDTCAYFLGEGRRLYGQTVPSEMPAKQLFTFRDPVGGPSVRRQRALRQWRSPVWAVGARSVHSLAVHELGLLWPATAGADGHRRARSGRRLSAAVARAGLSQLVGIQAPFR